MFDAVATSKNINKGGFRHNHAHFWAWPSYSYAHIFKDGSMIIYFNINKVQ